MWERSPSQPFDSENPIDFENEAREFLELLQTSREAVVLTGAGVSTDSGIPDFRSPDGLYSKVPSYIFDLDFFFNSPEEFYRLAKNHLYPMLNAQPNLTHIMLAKLEEYGLLKAVITQNIDGLHQKAGSETVVELHGNLSNAVCTECGARYDVSYVLKRLQNSPLPLCMECGGLIKPDIVFFNETLPEEALDKAMEFAEKADLFIAMGTSLVVYPAASLPLTAKSSGALLIIVNRDSTPYDELADRVWKMELLKFSRSVLKLMKAVT
ncbi:MAG: NAD-dependent deacetylase [Thermotogota bacterium]|nr:NAD-dependent deacetylase [Thermotogota bacterium]